MKTSRLPFTPPTFGLVCDASCQSDYGVKKRDGYFHGRVEWQAVDLSTGETVFQSPVQERSTANIGEALAIVDCLRYLHLLKDHKTPVYSDSLNGMSWVEKRVFRTWIPRNKDTEETFLVIEGAIRWLCEVNPANPILKWQTKPWGIENPADYGRK